LVHENPTSAEFQRHEVDALAALGQIRSFTDVDAAADGATVT
jgi:hypothetical protein